MSNAKKKDVSRREFLKQAGVALGGITLVSMGAATSCEKAPSSDTSSPTPAPSDILSPTPTPSETSLRPGYSVPPDPELMQIPDCDAYVALGRKYSANHIWVLQLPDGIVQVGMTESLHRIAYVLHYHPIEPSEVLLRATREDAFGYVVGAKINTDLIIPVSGTIIEVNRYISLEPSVTYTQGWLAKIKLSDPNELGKLYTPQYYAYLEAPTWSGPVPPMY